MGTSGKSAKKYVNLNAKLQHPRKIHPFDCNSALFNQPTDKPYHFSLPQICKESKRNEQCAKHNFWSMIPEHDVLQKKIRCIFEFSPNSPTDSEDEKFPSMPNTATPTPAILVSLPNGQMINPFDEELASRRRIVTNSATFFPTQQKQLKSIHPMIKSQNTPIAENRSPAKPSIQPILESKPQKRSETLFIAGAIAFWILGIILGKFIF